MAFHRKDSSEFELRVGGIDMMVGADMLRDCTIIENATASIPSISLTFVDNKRAASSYGAFVDGVPIKLSIGDGRNDPREYKFRQWSLSDATANTSGEVITLNGVADALEWFSKTVNKAYKGTAHEAIKKLAQEHGISSFDGDDTQDKMTWLPNGGTAVQLARFIADYSWAGEKKSHLLAMTSDNGKWKLRFKDILKKPRGGGRKLVSMGLATPEDHTVWDYRIFSDSMYHNRQANYGYEVAQENLKGDIDLFKGMDIDKISDSLGVNSSLKQTLGTSNVLYKSPSVGNTHDNYAKAYHHNVKARALYTTEVHVLISDMTNFKLLDDVEIKLARSNGDVDKAYSGSYKIAAISRHISKAEYREKLVLTSQGTNSDVFSQGL